jgi:hypothetical protein
VTESAQRITGFRSSGGAAAVAADIAADRGNSALTMLFASAEHDLAALGNELARTAYMERQGLEQGIEALLRDHCVTGFSSLGEQFNTIHANNSFTCLGVASLS